MDKYFYVINVEIDAPVDRSNSRDYTIVSAKEYSENNKDVPYRVVAPNGGEVIRFINGKQIRNIS
jgi:hypothetical protein